MNDLRTSAPICAETVPSEPGELERLQAELKAKEAVRDAIENTARARMDADR